MLRSAGAIVFFGFLMGCSSGSDPNTTNSAAALYFQMFYGGSYDMGPFNDAWNAARQNPAAGVNYTFPMLSTGIAPNSVVRLYAARPTGLTTGNDVVLKDAFQLSHSKIDATGKATFPPLIVSSGNWTSDTASIPSDLLCGETEFVVRAYRETNAGIPASEFLASASFVSVTQPCQ